MGLLTANVSVILDLSKFGIVDKPENFKLTFVCQGEPEPADIAHYKFEIDTNGPGFQDLGNSQYKMQAKVGYAGGQSSAPQILRAGVYLLDLVEVRSASGLRRFTGGTDFAKELSSVVLPQVPGDAFKPQIALVTYTFGTII